MINLSIITINYNNAAGLQKTFDSVFAQTFKNYEYIVIDGGSTDDSKNIVTRNENKLAYWVSEKDSGVYNAQNKGIGKATGEYVLFLNSGDHFDNADSLRSLFENSNREDIVYGDIIYKNGAELRTVVSPQIPDLNFLSTQTIPHPCTLIKRSLFLKIGLYNESFKICADWAFFLDAIVKYNASYSHVNVAVTVFELGGMSSDPVNAATVKSERAEYLNKEYSFIIREHKKYLDLRHRMGMLKNSRLLRVLTTILPGRFKKIINSDQ